MINYCMTHDVLIQDVLWISVAYGEQSSYSDFKWLDYLWMFIHRYLIY